MNVKEYSKVALSFIFILVCEIEPTLSQQCSNFGINQNHIGKRMEGHIILSTTEEKIYDCVKKCSMLNHCLSINYESVSGICQLNSVQSIDGFTDINENETFTLSDLSVWPQGMTGPCGEKPCTGRDQCFPVGSTYLCRDSDCPAPPVIDEATWTGSLEIGSKLVYKCTQSHRPSGQANVQCGWSNTWSTADFSCNAVTSCADLKLCDPTTGDGTYWVYPVTLQGVRIKVYCHDMDSTPTEYITVNPTDNDAFNSWPNGDTSKTIFSRLRLNVDTMTIVQNDLTFATTEKTGNGLAPVLNYGVGAACDCWKCPHQNGYFHIDTTDTGLIVNTAITWSPHGAIPVQNDFVRSSDGRTISAHGGGECGFTSPDSPLVMQVNSNEVIDDTTATFVTCV